MIKKSISALLLLTVATATSQAQTFEYDPPILVTPEDGWTISNAAFSVRYNPPDPSANTGNADFYHYLKYCQLDFGSNWSGNAWARPWTYELNVSQSQPLFDLQIATDTGFTNLVYDKSIYLWAMQHGGAEYIPELTRTSTNPWGLFNAGTYYWRMRCNIQQQISGEELWVNGVLESTGADYRGESDWSAYRTVHLVAAGTATSWRHEVSNTNPLMLITDAYPITDTTANLLDDLAAPLEDFDQDEFALDSFSASKRDNVAVCLDQRFKGPDRFKEYTYKINDTEVVDFHDDLVNAGYRIMAFHGHSLAEQDWLYQQYPNDMVGTFTGETEDLAEDYHTGDGHDIMTNTYYQRSVLMANDHGGYFINAVLMGANRLGKEFDGHFMDYDTDPDVYDEIQFMEEFGDHIIFGSKDTKWYTWHYTNALWYGLWLDGLIGNRCLWMEEYGYRWANDSWADAYNNTNNSANPFPLFTNANPAWSNGKFNRTVTPMAFKAQQMVKSAAMGTTVYVWRDNRNTYDAGAAGSRNRWARKEMIFKLYEQIIDQSMIPSIFQARSFNPVAVEFMEGSEFTISTGESQPFDTKYRDYHVLFDTLYGLGGGGVGTDVNPADPLLTDLPETDVIPNDKGRFKMLPIVSPKVSRPTSWVNRGVVTKTVHQAVPADPDQPGLMTVTDVNNLFDDTALFPKQNTGSGGWVHIYADNSDNRKTFIVNSHESEVRAANEYYFIPYDTTTDYIEVLKGYIKPWTYMMAKVTNGGDDLWLTVNTHRFDQYTDEEYNGDYFNHADLPTANAIIKIECASKPGTIRINGTTITPTTDGVGALSPADWDTTKSELWVTIDFSDYDTATSSDLVEIVVKKL